MGEIYRARDTRLPREAAVKVLPPELSGDAERRQRPVGPKAGYSPRLQGLMGRPRWMPGGRAIAFIGRDENGVDGVHVQDFVPGTDTAKTRRRLGSFDPDTIAQTLDVSPDRTRLIVGAIEPVFGISIAENVPRVRKVR
jgi:hypothetical protein